MRLISAAVAGLLALTAASTANAGTVVVTVGAQSQPWDPATNPALPYGTNDGAAPAAVSAGFSFAPGGVFTITYLDGLTSPFGGTPYATALGDTTYVTNGAGGSSGAGFPSMYVDYSTTDTYLNELFGTFADAAGHVVGNPFAVGLGGTFTTPTGATQLFLGFNDDIFADNTGSLRVSVSGPDAVVAVPEPATWTMLLIGFGAVGATMRSRRRRQALALA